MDEEQLNAIRERDARQSSFEDLGQVSRDRRYLLGEVDRLTKWQTQMMVVFEGMQELGTALGLRLGDSITGTKALEAVNKLKSENTELREALEGMVDQHCAADQGDLDSFAIGASADAMLVLEELGRLDITYGQGRRVIGHWKEAENDG